MLIAPPKKEINFSLWLVICWLRPKRRVILSLIVSFFANISPMSEFQKNFDVSIWKVVSRINAGRVMSYGEVACAAGFPRHARMVSKAMSRSPETLPWYRVVRSNRTLAFDVASDAYKKQAELLKNEGVNIVKGKVIPIMSDADTSLDELLWGIQE